MKNRALKIILLANVLLLTLSLFGAHVDVPFLSISLRFKPINELLSFPLLTENLKADSLISSYVSRESAGNQPDGSGENNSTDTSGTFINPCANGRYALDNFFNALLNEGNYRTVRVAHFGDSQIEGDRISSQLRSKLQAVLGGDGYGFVPLNDIASPVSYDRHAGDNLIRYNVFSKRLPSGLAYGLSGDAFRLADFSRHTEDTTSIANENAMSDEASGEKLNYSKQGKSADVSFKFPGDRSFSSAFLLFGKVNGKLHLTIRGDDDAIVYTADLSENGSYCSNELNKLDIPIDRIKRRLSLHISGQSATVFYGLYLDGQNKLQVDNYGIRGHSGDGLLLLDDSFIHLQLQYLDTRLLIFQFGGNSVPHVLSMEKKELISKIYTSLFAKFRRMMPDASILVVGVGDMAKSFDGEYRSYPGLPMVRDALKQAALNANCAFWDLYEMMGGQNSILKWADKGLAARDGHFTLGGERIVANELANHILREFRLYKQRNNLP